MRNFVKPLISMASLLSAGACINHASPLGPAATNAMDQGEGSMIHDGRGENRAGNMTTERFMAFWDMEYGYILNPDGDLDTIITPEFENDNVLQAFNTFFSNENIINRINKRTYCECTGERYERDGAIFYRIREARLFAE